MPLEDEAVETPIPASDMDAGDEERDGWPDE